MAIDKAVDSTQLNADLTSIANAIRTKGETGAPLAFPNGFISAIQDIQTGGVTVVETQDAKGGKIIEISGDATKVEPITITENGITTAPTGTAYSPITVNVGGSGSKRYIIKDGEIQDGFVFQVTSPSAISENPNGFFELSVTGNEYGFCYINNIDFSNFKYIITEFYLTSKISGWSFAEFTGGRIVPSITSGSGDASSDDSTNTVYYDWLGAATGNIRAIYSIVNVESINSGHIKLIIAGTGSHPSANLDITNMYLVEDL